MPPWQLTLLVVFLAIVFVLAVIDIIQGRIRNIGHQWKIQLGEFGDEQIQVLIDSEFHRSTLTIEPTKSKRTGIHAQFWVEKFNQRSILLGVFVTKRDTQEILAFVETMKSAGRTPETGKHKNKEFMFVRLKEEDFSQTENLIRALASTMWQANDQDRIHCQYRVGDSHSARGHYLESARIPWWWGTLQKTWKRRDRE